MPDDLLARIDAERKRYDQEREANRARFPFAMSMMDPIRAAGLEPRLKHAVNAAGEELGRPVPLPGIGVDGDKLAHLPEFEASWRRFYAKQPDDRKTYNERMQRAIRPHMRGNEE
ncbi:hypothetical protein HBF26_17180 [Luteibacter jiangsuensis]|uniref:Uncharacterized protein n=1 Tax=Luteibacter jiangsuensis TaxID=637577 RepID=A0ABX0QAK5_9GAMM|nr:hypothetical protein [Luteibacter jiangsuensis]NID06631.1 hypothetical protein [Luteibacter jiangsuensis]